MLTNWNAPRPQGIPSWTLWRQTKHVRVPKRHYVYNDGCREAFVPFVLPGLCALFMAIGLLFKIIGFSTPYWVYYETGSSGTSDYRELYFGLWETCAVIGNAPVDCGAMIDNDLPDWMKIVMALATTSLVILVLGTFFLFYWLCNIRRTIIWKVVIIIALFIGLCCAQAAVLVFRFEGETFVEDVLTENAVPTLDFDWGWSFYIYAVSIGFTLLCPSLMICVPAYGSYRPDEYPAQRMAHIPHSQESSRFNTWNTPNTHNVGYRNPIMPVVLPRMQRATSLQGGYGQQPLGFGSQGRPAAYHDPFAQQQMVSSMPRGYSRY